MVGLVAESGYTVGGPTSRMVAHSRVVISQFWGFIENNWDFLFYVFLSCGVVNSDGVSWVMFFVY